MADWPRTVSEGGDVDDVNVIEEIIMDEGSTTTMMMMMMMRRRRSSSSGENGDDDADYGYENSGDSVKLFQDLCHKGDVHDDADEGIITIDDGMRRLLPRQLKKDECRKKKSQRRCVDRYDSSESSDSGVAVLSCTDCSGSSTASSDITEPGSPFSTASSHSEDSGSSKMPPTSTHHHPSWPWASVPQVQEDDLASSNKRPLHLQNKNKPVMSSKRFKSEKKKNVCKAPKMQQGKITEYFRSQCKSNVNVIKKDMFKLNDISVSSNSGSGSSTSESIINHHNKRNNSNVGKFDQQTQFNGLKAAQGIIIKATGNKKKQSPSLSMVVPRKILPAPTNTDKISINEQLSNMATFTPTVTLTALSFPPNYAYLHHHQKTIAATITNDKIPIPCLNVLQPVQKIATINNFNCVKLNATVVPIVKVIQQQQQPQPQMIIETAVPTVIAAKPRNLSDLSNFTPPPKQHCNNTNSNVNNNSKCSVSNSTLQNVVNQRNRRSPTLILDMPFKGTTTTSSTSSSSSIDSDSGISNGRECLLEVSVSNSHDHKIVEQQKSPILSQPKTIRFPARQQERKEEAAKPTPQHSLDGRCRWAECNSRFDTSGALLEHLQIKHVICQTTQEHFVCLWLGCKVHGRTSCSRSWLERHVLAHAGTKPFRCIVDGCGQRFNSQLMLERHVNGHFNSDGSPNNGSAKKTTDNNASKLYKRNGKRIRFRRQPWSARMFDFFDSGIMEGLQHNLLLLTQKRTLGQISEPGDTVQLQSQILARRTETDGNIKLLLRWHPQDIVPDEWVSEKDYEPTKSTSIPSLTASSKTALNPSLFSVPLKGNHHQPRQKHCRKPIIVKRT